MDIIILSATNAQPYSRRVALYQANLTLIPKLEKKNKHKHKLRTRQLQINFGKPNPAVH